MIRGMSVLLAPALALLMGCAAAPARRVPVAERSVPAQRGESPAMSPAPTVPSGQAATPAPVPRKPATGTFDDARRHLVRGTAAIEMAKTESDLGAAADEFQMATEISPEWAFAWYNLGYVQAKMGRLTEAMASYRRFLALAPDDKDAGKVSDELIKLEFRMEQTARIQGRAGLWLHDSGGMFAVTAEGNHLAFKSSSLMMSSQELDANTFWTDTPKPPQREFQLELQGSAVTGTSSRSELIVGKCTVPAELVEVSGQYDEAAGRLNLKVPRSKFRANTTLNLFLDPVDCSGVSVVDKRIVDVTFYGPLPDGWIGAYVDSAYLPGAIMIRYESSGHLGVTGVVDSPAKAAGLQPKDEILAIDGVPVNTLSAGAAVRRLYGAPGSEVTLSVLHRKEKVPVEIRFQRIRRSR